MSCVRHRGRTACGRQRGSVSPRRGGDDRTMMIMLVARFTDMLRYNLSSTMESALVDPLLQQGKVGDRLVILNGHAARGEARVRSLHTTQAGQLLFNTLIIKHGQHAAHIKSGCFHPYPLLSAYWTRSGRHIRTVTDDGAYASRSSGCRRTTNDRRQPAPYRRNTHGQPALPLWVRSPLRALHRRSTRSWASTWPPRGSSDCSQHRRTWLIFPC